MIIIFKCSHLNLILARIDLMKFNWNIYSLYFVIVIVVVIVVIVSFVKYNWLDTETWFLMLISNNVKIVIECKTVKNVLAHKVLAEYQKVTNEDKFNIGVWEHLERVQKEKKYTNHLFFCSYLIFFCFCFIQIYIKLAAHIQRHLLKIF